MFGARASGWLPLVVVGVVGCGGGAGGEPRAAEGERGAMAKEPVKETPAKSAAPHEEEEQAPEAVVQLSFEPLVTGVRPGGKFLLAAHFRIAPGYRIGWKFPGDVGQETKVELRGPAGFEVGPPQFPVPDRYKTAGYVGFGYEKETAVFVEVKAPGKLRGNAVHRFDLEASWVACKKECATERTEAFVELATSYGGARAREVEESLAPFRARLPKPLSDLRDAEQKWETGGRNAALVVKMPKAKPRDFLPDGKSEPAPKKVKMGDGELRFVFDEAPRAGWRPLRGVVVAAVDGKDAFYDLEATTPK